MKLSLLRSGSSNDLRRRGLPGLPDGDVGFELFGEWFRLVEGRGNLRFGGGRWLAELEDVERLCVDAAASG